MTRRSGSAMFQFRRHFLRHAAEINRFPAQFDARHAGEIEQGVDEPVHAPGAFIGFPEVSLALLFELVAAQHAGSPGSSR